jgi:hypothetical protein
MEKSNNIERSEVWKQIHNLVKQIPREECIGDAPDAPSVATELEELFLKLQRVSNLAKFCQKIAKQKDCPPEFIEIVNKEFWNLI